jgi:hypothetical protein
LLVLTLLVFGSIWLHRKLTKESSPCDNKTTTR